MLTLSRSLSAFVHPQVLLLISSERGQIYSFATPKLQPILVNENSKQLIEQCLNAPDPMALPPAPMPMEPPPQMPPQAPPQAQLMPPQPQGMPPGMHVRSRPLTEHFRPPSFSVPLPHLALFCALLFS